MTQKEIFLKEQDNYTRIFLYREGIFWKAYEKSAYRIVSSFPTFKPIKKYVKTVGEAIVSIGFPCAVFEKYIPTQHILSQEEKQVTVRADEEEINGLGFNQWKDKIPLFHNSSVVNDTERASVMDQLLSTLRGFNIETHTPMECMMCLSELRTLAVQL